MKTAWKRFAATAAATIAVTTLSATPARADDVGIASTPCPTYALCLYQHSGWNNILTFPASVFTSRECVPNLTQISYPSSRVSSNDSITGVVNNTGMAINLFEHTNYDGRFTQIPAGGNWENL
ncbi:hypothetical protein, partial [Actinoplanes palleronii]